MAAKLQLFSIFAKEMVEKLFSGLGLACTRRISLIIRSEQTSAALTVEVEGFFYLFFGGRLVDADVTNVAQEGKVDGGGRQVLLVVGHQFQQTGVVLAGDGQSTVVVEDEADGLPHLVDREATLGDAQVELADQAPGYGIAVEDGLIKERGMLHGKRLEGVPHGVPQVEGFAQSLLGGVFEDDALLHRYALGEERGNRGAKKTRNSRNTRSSRDSRRVSKECGPMLLVVKQPVLQHLGIAGEYVLRAEGTKELGIDDDALGIAEDANLVFQSAEVDTRLAAYAGIDHSQERGGDIDEPDAALEGRGSEASKVGHHAATQVDEQRMARSPMLLQLLPDMGERLQALVGVACRNDDGVGASHAVEVCDDGHT